MSFRTHLYESLPLGTILYPFAFPLSGTGVGVGCLIFCVLWICSYLFYYYFLALIGSGNINESDVDDSSIGSSKKSGGLGIKKRRRRRSGIKKR